MDHDPNSLDEDTVWSMFLEFVERSGPPGSVESLMSSFRGHVEKIMPNRDAEEVVALTRRLMGSRPGVWPMIFDRIYSSDHPVFNTEPNRLLAGTIEARPPGRALDVAMGQGRNAVFLAEHGWDVTGIDVSEVGIESARLQAKSMGVELKAIRADFSSYDMGDATWDLILFTYVPVPITDPDNIHRIERSLVPGGLIVIESFAWPAPGTARRPVHVHTDELRAGFMDFDILQFDVTDDLPDWSQDPQPVVRMVAARR